MGATQARWTASAGASACEVRFDDGTTLPVDLDVEAGGTGLPVPHQLLDAALAACTTLTLELYIKRKGWAIAAIRVAVEHRKDGATYALARRIEIDGTLDAEQRAALLRIAEACPVHKTLIGEIAIATSLA